jgi:pimeloyl-ACP methyl ester carboxylesterase
MKPIAHNPILFHSCSHPQLKGAVSKMAYCSWGDPQAVQLVFCVHGLTRQKHDFDILAQSLAQQGAYIVATDAVGRGDSEWLPNPLHYSIPTYVAHHLSLLAHLESRHTYAAIDWVGTSMGGLIGMGVAATAAMGLAPRIRKLVLNDVGPELNHSGLDRISDYVGKTMEFDDVDKALDHLHSISQGFGPHTPEEWRRFNLPMLRPIDKRDTTLQGRVRLHYDPAIANAFAHTTPDMLRQGSALLWQTFRSIQSDILLLRGAQSDLLSADSVYAMQAAKPKMAYQEFSNVGHAPTLIHPHQIQPVLDFLRF